MKKIYILLCLLVASISYAQKQTETLDVTFPCYQTKALFKTLREQYKESPVIMGKADDDAKSTMSLWIHPLENNWTIVVTKDDLSCIVGVGSDFKILGRKLGIDV